MFVLFFYCPRLEFFSPGVLSLNPRVIFTTTLPGFSKETKGYTHTHTHTHLWYCFYLVPKEIQPVPPKGNQSWIFIGRTGVEAETPILWPPDAKNRLIGKHPDAGNDWRPEEKGTTGWDGWMASLTQWTWVWVNSGHWWWTGRPGVLWSMGSQRVKHYWMTELNWSDIKSRLK